MLLEMKESQGSSHWQLEQFTFVDSALLFLRSSLKNFPEKSFISKGQCMGAYIQWDLIGLMIVLTILVKTWHN